MLQGFQALLALLVLLPGFVSARIARSISAPAAQTDVERILDALIFSFFIYILYLFLFGGTMPLEWSATVDAAKAAHYSLQVHYRRLTFLCFTPVLLGLFWGSLQHRDTVLALLRKWHLTDRTNAVSVWNDALKGHGGSVQVGLADGREVVGWLQQYSDADDERSLFLAKVAWVKEDGSRTMIPGPGILLTDKSEIRYIMFLDEEQDEQTKEELS